MSPDRQFDEVSPEDQNLRLDLYLSRLAPELTRSYIQKLVLAGAARVNGVIRKPGYRLRAGDRVAFSYEPPPPEEFRMDPWDAPLDILYADEHVAVLNKPAGLVVHPGAGHPEKTLVHALLHHFPEIRGVGPEDRAGIVHRLDRETSGVMVVARTTLAYDELRRQFKDREVKKVYLGLVRGRMRRRRGEMTWALGRHTTHGDRISIHTRTPRVAITEYQVLREYRDASLLEIHPLTGRTHQIRVHMATAGHPIVGDTLYGGEKDIAASPRLFLHAHRLTFRHPATGQMMTFRSSLPNELKRVLKAQKPPRKTEEEEEADLVRRPRFRG